MEERSRALTQPSVKFKERPQKRRSVELNPLRFTGVSLTGEVRKGNVSRGNCCENGENETSHGSLREQQKKECTPGFRILMGCIAIM